MGVFAHSNCAGAIGSGHDDVAIANLIRIEFSWGISQVKTLHLLAVTFARFHEGRACPGGGFNVAHRINGASAVFHRYRHGAGSAQNIDYNDGFVLDICDAGLKHRWREERGDFHKM